MVPGVGLERNARKIDQDLLGLSTVTFATGSAAGPWAGPGVSTARNRARQGNHGGQYNRNAKCPMGFRSVSTAAD
jgi:hypothetical protein